MRMFSHLLAFMAAFCIAGCAQPSQAQTAERFVVKGRVTDQNGRPLKGVEVVADNEFLYAAYATGRTGPDGRYRIELPHVASTWNVTASTKLNIGGQMMEVDLAPDNPDSFAGNTGAIRNFSVQAAGERSDGTGRHYGGSVLVYTQIMSDYTAVDVELTLTPVNGGQPITAKPSWTGDGAAIKDVPLGQYRVSASVNGSPIGVRIRNQGNYGRTVTAGFTQIMKGVNHMEIEVR